MITVMGAAGNVGGKVADLLLQGNETIRVLEHTRSLDGLAERGAEVVRGDALNVEDMRALFRDADAAFVVLPDNVDDPDFVANRSRMSQAITAALRDTGVSHVVALTVVGADREGAPGPPAGLHDHELRLSELRGTSLLVLRPAAYMDYLLASLPLIRSQQLNGSAVDGDVVYPMVATQDVAREAAERLARRDWNGHQSKLLLGPEDVSMRQATSLIGSLLGLPDLPYVEFPPAQMKDGLVAAGMSEEAARLLVDMQLGINDGWFFGDVRRTPDTTMPTRLEEFLKHALAA
ncbi:MAG TPA: NAD(P)H-binding protein [Actinomycetota bacterium]|jgi:uncharacterized protein YbjT (DUF2867 family)|nr:NAD(P)H-binding protein [Actinomycetota bacterium]